MNTLLALSPVIWATYATGVVITMRWCERRPLGREARAVAASLAWFLFWPLWTLARGTRTLRGWNWRRNGLPRARIKTRRRGVDATP